MKLGSYRSNTDCLTLRAAAVAGSGVHDNRASVNLCSCFDTVENNLKWNLGVAEVNIYTWIPVVVVYTPHDWRTDAIM